MFTFPCVTCLHTFMFQLPDRQYRVSLDSTHQKAANFIGAWHKSLFRQMSGTEVWCGGIYFQEVEFREQSPLSCSLSYDRTVTFPTFGIFSFPYGYWVARCDRNMFAVWENLDDSEVTNRAWESIRENIRISAKENFILSHMNRLYGYCSTDTKCRGCWHTTNFAVLWKQEISKVVKRKILFSVHMKSCQLICRYQCSKAAGYLFLYSE
jgi:hypothetical protein